MVAKDGFGNDWILPNAKDVLEGFDEITLRGLHYQLVAMGYPNTLKHYKRLVSVMSKARWDREIPFYKFTDYDREMIGQTWADETDYVSKVMVAKDQIRAWMEHYSKNRWENQDNYVEVWIEKKALIGVFRDVCERHDVGLAPCKGYPSLTFLYEASERLYRYADKNLVIIYFGDYDPSGEDIPRNIVDSLSRLGVSVDLERIALTEDFVISHGLPPAPTKSGDTRSVYWDGMGQVELDAVSPSELKQLCEEAILSYFNEDDYNTLMDEEDEERHRFRAELRDFVMELAGEEE